MYAASHHKSNNRKYFRTKNATNSICALQGTKLTWDLQIHTTDDARIILLPGTNPHYGLGFTDSRRMIPHIHRYWSVSDRIAILQLNVSRTIQAPSINVDLPSERSQAETEEFYDTLQGTVQPFRHRVYFILGDFNGKIGHNSTLSYVVGLHACGYRNPNGTQLHEFCSTNNLYLANTTFQKRARKSQHGMAPGTHSIYNQIDYIVSASIQILLMDAQSHPGTYADSDHRLLLASMRIPNVYKILQRVNSRNTWALEFYLSLIHDANICNLFQIHIGASLSAISDIDNVEWTAILDRIIIAANQKSLGTNQRLLGIPSVMRT